MLLRTFAALLILHLATADRLPYLDVDSLVSVGTVNFKGSSLRVFEVDGAQVTEPRVSFGDTCDSLRYSYVYQKYQLTIPISIEVNTLEAPTGSCKKVGQVTITRLKVKADEALASKDAKVTIVAHLTKPGQAQLLFLCDTFLRCQQMMEDVSSNPEQFRSTIRLAPVGRIGSNPVRFGDIQSATLPKFSCVPGRWVVFQRRVDGSLSFAQNWDTYVKGFGNPQYGNYWMGLDQLFTMTATSTTNGYPLTSRCQLRIDTEDWSGKTYWGEYKLFEVLDSTQNYRLRVDQEVSGSRLTNFARDHSEMQFSTYDRDHDTLGVNSCSQMFGYGGWWFSNCHSLNLNGAYTTDKTIDDNPTYNTVVAGKHVPMKSSVMKFKCN